MSLNTEIIDDFFKWEDTIKDEILDVEALLSTKLQDQPEGLINDLKIIETWSGRLGYLLSEANSWLDKASFALKPSNDSGTIFDREIELKSSVAPFKALSEHLESLSRAVFQRISLGQSILKFHLQFAEPRLEKPF